MLRGALGGVALLFVVTIDATAIPTNPSNKASLAVPEWNGCGASSPHGYKCLTVSSGIAYSGLFRAWGVNANCAPQHIVVSVTAQVNSHLQFWHYTNKASPITGRCAGVTVPVDCLGFRWNENADPSESEWMTIAYENTDTGEVGDITGVTIQLADAAAPRDTPCSAGGLALIGSRAFAQNEPSPRDQNFLYGLRQGATIPSGPITDTETAIARARALLGPIDAATGVKSAATLTARQDGDVWTVQGPPTCPEPGCESTTIVKLSAKDGHMLYARHPE